MTAPEKDLIRGDLAHTTLSPPGVPTEHEGLLERFRLENANLRRQLKEAKADSVLQLNKASALWDKFTKEIQALQKEITEARKQIEQLNERINSMIKSDGR